MSTRPRPPAPKRFPGFLSCVTCRLSLPFNDIGEQWPLHRCSDRKVYPFTDFTADDPFIGAALERIRGLTDYPVITATDPHVLNRIPPS